MPGRIAIFQGHPDPAGGHFCHALARAYAEGAKAAGHELREFDLAKIEAFLEQALRPGFAIGTVGADKRWVKLLGGRSARLVVTMGMPAFVYRWYFGSHGLKGLERNVLRFCGIGPIRETLIGNVEGMRAARREQLLLDLRALGQAAR